jgi:hypothetical protein
MFLGNSDAIATASQHQQAGKSKDSGYLLQREGDSGLELSVNCAAGVLIRKKLECRPPSEARKEPAGDTVPPVPLSNSLSFRVTPHLSCDEIEKFSRQILCTDVGVQGQAAVIRGRVLIVGLGGAIFPPHVLHSFLKNIGFFRSWMPCICLRCVRRCRHSRPC